MQRIELEDHSVDKLLEKTISKKATSTQWWNAKLLSDKILRGKFRVAKSRLKVILSIIKFMIISCMYLLTMKYEHCAPNMKHPNQRLKNHFSS